jgi:hypothetical protein
VHGLVTGVGGDGVGLPHADQFGLLSESGQGGAVGVGEREALVVVDLGEDVGGEPQDRVGKGHAAIVAVVRNRVHPCVRARTR